MGKTALIDLFCRQVGSEDQINRPRPECGRVRRQGSILSGDRSSGTALLAERGQEACARHAAEGPSWYAQLAALHGGGSARGRSTRGERMLNEICDAIEECGRRRH